MTTTQTKAYLDTRPIPMPDSAEIKDSAPSIEFSATAYNVGDLIQVCRLPIGVRCIDWGLIFPKIDSNGTPTFAFSLGIQNSAGTDIGTEVWGTGLTAGQSNTIYRAATSAAQQGDTTVERIVVMKVTTAAATYAGANLVGDLFLKLRG